MDEYTNTFGETNPVPTINDCSSNPHSEKNVEDYFDFLSNLIAKNDIQKYTFHDVYGVPLNVTGNYDQNDCADCMAPGFSITFEIIE